MNSHPGEIKAQILEENGQVIMRKTCPTHGEFEDVLATDAKFLERIESLFFGSDFRSAEDEHIHKHGTSDIKYGRGAVLTVDLTNRCNMMCNPCFMDANQVGYVHEPTFEDTKTNSSTTRFRSNRNDKLSFYFPAANRRLRRTFWNRSRMRKRSVFTES